MTVVVLFNRKGRSYRMRVARVHRHWHEEQATDKAL
jgi:hypothetical protein